MRFPTLLGLLISYSVALLSQPPGGPATTPLPGARQPAGTNATTIILPELDRLQGVISALNSTVPQLKIEKWKADSNSKRQAEANSESIQRNLHSALPGMVSGVRSAPEDIGSNFKLYRNVNALYDVLSSLTESAGAFGPKNDYKALAQQLDSLDGIRRSLGDSLEQLTISTQSQLDQLRTQVKTLQAQESAPPPKRVVVDDTQPAAKSSTSHKKKTKKADGNSGGATTSSPQ